MFNTDEERVQADEWVATHTDDNGKICSEK